MCLDPKVSVARECKNVLGLDSFCKQVEDTVDEMAFTSHGSLKLLKDFHCFLLFLYKPDPGWMLQGPC